MREIDLTNLALLDLSEPHTADVVTWQGRRALRLESGLVLIKDLDVADAVVELELGADQGAYPGLAFRVGDDRNYELIYVQPHTSGEWDAMQYDPVFGGANTWQVFNGPHYQAAATIPMGQWLTLWVHLSGLQACANVGGQPPLNVARLAHGREAGRIGVWTFRPAYFGRMRILPAQPDAAPVPPAALPQPAPGAVMDWWLEGHGRVTAEPHGTLNLNRYLTATEAVLTRAFDLADAGEVTFAFGFSDTLRLLVDDAEVFSGTHRFTGFSDRNARGYIEPEAHRITRHLSAGRHTITAQLKVEEGFGWGLALSLLSAATLR